VRHVLVIEDDAQNALVFQKILEKRGGFRVSVSDDPARIFAIIDAGVDLVVMDVSLAHSHWQGRQVNGIDLCRMIKRDPNRAHVPVMLATAHAMRGDAEKLIVESGADDYISKPIVDHAAFIEQVKSNLPEAA
jgi:two-component system, cell cycle response regulator DivK